MIKRKQPRSVSIGDGLNFYLKFLICAFCHSGQRHWLVAVAICQV